jgi:glutathione S-transferase
MKLIIGNKNYSSWSVRPWLVLTHFQHPVRRGAGTCSAARAGARRYARSRPRARCRCWSTATSRCTRASPSSSTWPNATRTRRSGRQIASCGRWPGAAAAEMHAGFGALRNAAPMNLRASYPNRIDLDAVAGDLRGSNGSGAICWTARRPLSVRGILRRRRDVRPARGRIRTYDLPTSDTGRRICRGDLCPPGVPAAALRCAQGAMDRAARRDRLHPGRPRPSPTSHDAYDQALRRASRRSRSSKAIAASAPIGGAPTMARTCTSTAPAPCPSAAPRWKGRARSTG